MRVEGLNWGMMTFAVGLKHAERVYDWTGAIIKAISQCGLDGQYWISTKDCGTTIVIHCKDYFYEGDCERVAAEVSRLNLTADISETQKSEEHRRRIVVFEGLLERSGLLTRGEYPWIMFKKEDRHDG